VPVHLSDAPQFFDLGGIWVRAAWRFVQREVFSLLYVLFHIVI